MAAPKNNLPNKFYPAWICSPCGRKYGNGFPPGHVATWHDNKCGLCGAENVPVTEPRDFGHLKKGWNR